MGRKVVCHRSTRSLVRGSQGSLLHDCLPTALNFFAQSLHFCMCPLAQSKAAGYILGMDWSLQSSAYLEAEGKGYEECRNV